MGMAASQARLLTITARMHDVEYKAQSIQNAKVSLATQSDEVYQEYLEALDATTLTVKDYQGNLITANFNTLCGIDAVDSKYKYALFDEKGRLLVGDEEAKGYNEFKQKYPDGDAYEFALYMLGIFPDEKENEFDNKYKEQTKLKTEEIMGKDSKDQDLKDLLETIELKALEILGDNPDNLDLKGLIDKVNEQDLQGKNKDKKKELDILLDKYAYQLSKRYSEEFYNNIFTDDETIKDLYDEDDYNYYVSLFKQIQANGNSYVGINSSINISAYDGFNGDAANDSEWLQNMIQAGKITVDHVETDKKTGNVSFATTGVPSDSVLEYTTTSTIDKTALAKAEAEYEHKTKEIDRKDKKFDLDLSKLDTERTALKTEYESVKKVIEENIDRTFGIFS